MHTASAFRRYIGGAATSYVALRSVRVGDLATRVGMEFGVFDHLDRYGGPLADFYEDRLRITEAYDRAGFYAYHLAEHHSTPLGMAPSPSVFLSRSRSARGRCASARWCGRCRCIIRCG